MVVVEVMASPEGFTENKYRKLATEYAKLKAQLPVLKQAYFDEKAHESELQEKLKQKDQGLRKAEQELESLSFRNQQLTVRIQVLQDELEKSTHSGSKKRHSRADSDASNHGGMSVINEELQNKIRENERLHSQLTQIQSESSNTIMQLRDRVDTLEYTDKKRIESVESEAKEQKDLIGRLREDKAVLEVRIQNQEQTVRDAKLTASSVEDKLKVIGKQLNEEQKLRKRVLEEKVIFHDTSNSDYNSLNIPTHNRAHQMKVMDHLKLVYNNIKLFCDSLSDFYCYLSQRTKVYPAGLLDQKTTSISDKLCKYLESSPAVCGHVHESFRKFHESQNVNSVTTLDTVEKLPSFTDNFHILSNHMCKLSNYVHLCIEEENSLSSVTQSCIDQNNRVVLSWKKLTDAFKRTSSHLSLISYQSLSDEHPRENHSKMLSLLSQALVHLTNMCKDFSVQYNSKSALDNELPTVPPELSDTDKCLTKSLITLTTSVNKISSFLTEHNQSFSEYLHHNTESSAERKHPLISTYQQSVDAYLSQLVRPKPKSVPYSVAINNMETILSSTESRDSLSQQVNKLNDKVQKLETEKEHWMLEAQLFKIKIDKQNKAGEAGRSSPVPNNITGGTSVVQTRENNRVSQGQSDADMDAETREKLLKSHYQKRISELTLTLQSTDSNAAAFHAECRALVARLTAAEKSRNQAQELLTQSENKILSLKDELSTTKKSYDAQLGTMSEALASMNDMLASQSDEVESLKSQLQMVKRASKRL